MTHLKKANRLLSIWQEHGPDSYPVDLDLIVAELVNKSSGSDRLNLATEPLRQVDGAMMRSRENPNSYTAFVNSNVTNLGRKRFTLAHEIGHFVLHRRIQDEFQCSRLMLSDFRTKGIELEANQFASQLLVPPNRARDFDGQKWTTDTLEEVASKFEVSLQAAGLRMAVLSSRPIGFVVSVGEMVEWGCASKSLYARGCYFKQMMDVPENSTAFGSEYSDERLNNVEILRDAWGINETFRESSIRGYDDRIYTCIDVS